MYQKNYSFFSQGSIEKCTKDQQMGEILEIIMYFHFWEHYHLED